MRTLPRLSSLGTWVLALVVAACSSDAGSDATPLTPQGSAGTGISPPTAGAGGAASPSGGSVALGGGGSATTGGTTSNEAGTSPALGGSGGETGGSPAGGAAGSSAVTPSAAARQRVIDYFESIRGKGTLMGIENKGTTRGDTDKVKAITGKFPAFWGNDFGFGSGAVDKRPAMIDEAIAQWKAGAIVGLMYHACAPYRDEYCTWDDIGDKHPQHLTDQQWNDITTPGTELYETWLARLDKLAGFFQKLKEAGVAPMFRPFHEVNQCVFWWSCKTGDHGSKRLFQITHDYLTKDKGLDNIVWNWNIQDFTTLASDVGKYNPGPEYFDMVSLDVYNTGYTKGNYDAMRGTSAGKPIAIGECMFMPSADVLNQQPQWTYALLWPDFYANNPKLADAYAGPRAVTLDEMPGWK
jgi:hypothetical protein